MQDLLIEFLSHYGLSEVSGPKSNPDIIAMGDDLGYDVEDDSTTAWCSLAMNYYAKKCGYEITNSLSARSWLSLPKPIIVLKPQLGDIVVLWRVSPTDWRGHVALFINWNENYVYTLGGNQNNSISIVPYSRQRILGFRQLHKIKDIQ